MRRPAPNPRPAGPADDPGGGGASPGAAPALARALNGWRGPLLAALVAVAAALPGLLSLPPLDRAESRAALAAAASGRPDGAPAFRPDRRPEAAAGGRWLQAGALRLSVALSAPQSATGEARDVRALRWPSLLGAALAAAACAWGGAALLGPVRGAAAGAVLAASPLLSTAGASAGREALLCGGVTLALAGIARLYARERGLISTTGGARLALWAGTALAVFDAGAERAVAVPLALLALAAADRRGRWMRGLGWTWGLVLLAATAGPWLLAACVATDGGVWARAAAARPARFAAGASGLHAALAPLMLFPATLLLPAAAVRAWRGGGESGVRLALAWLLSAWAVLEAAPDKLAGDALPLYGALAWLCAAPLGTPDGFGRWTRRLGAGLTAAAGLGAATAAAWAGWRFAPAPAPAATVAAALATAGALAAAGLAGAGLLLAGRPARALAIAGALALLAHLLLAAALLPRLDRLWTSRRAAELLARADLDPRNGLTPGPVTVAGYGEPSLLFALGAGGEPGDASAAAEGLAEGRPALVEARAQGDLLRALHAAHTAARAVGEVSGYDYAARREVRIVLWRPPPSAAPAFLEEPAP